MNRYLVFDSGCSTCNHLAETIQRAAGGKLTAISIHSVQARALLDRAYPDGWVHAPYLVAEAPDKVGACTGIALALRLGLLLGPRKARQVWALARRYGIAAPSARQSATGYLPSRRQFLKGASAVALALGLAAPDLQRASVASADVGCPCLTTTRVYDHTDCGQVSWCGACQNNYEVWYKLVDPCGNFCGWSSDVWCNDPRCGSC